MKFSIIVVALNAGEELIKTVDNILQQTYEDFEIIIKDGMSNDGSVEKIPTDPRIILHVQRDSGIYDAMNQAITYASGDYVLFINCGDTFYHQDVLKQCKNFISDYEANCSEQSKNTIFYGDCYTENRGYILKYPDKFDGYLCFSKTLCHQSTIYPLEMLKRKKFNLNYKIAADCEYYVSSYAKGGQMIHIPVAISNYQGNGASEATNNIKISLNERKEILKANFNKSEYLLNTLKYNLHGGAIKLFLVRQKWFYKVYSTLAKIYYVSKKR